MFEDTNALIEEVVTEGRKQRESNQEDANHLRGQIAELNQSWGGYMRLLLDPEISKVTKSEIDLHIQRSSAERHGLTTLLDRMGDRAIRTSERLMEEIRAVVSEARQSFSAVGSPDKLHSFIERFVGPSISLPDGSLISKPESIDASLTGYVAATGHEHAAKVPENQVTVKAGGTISGTVADHLREIISAWPRLSAADRESVLRIVLDK